MLSEHMAHRPPRYTTCLPSFAHCAERCAGGSKIILKYAGKDATSVPSLSRLLATDTRRSEEYEPIHPPDAITSNLPPEKQYAPAFPFVTPRC
jgi:hypothetical protein